MVQKVGILMGTGQCMRHLTSITSTCQPMYAVLFGQLFGHAAQPLPQGSRTVLHLAQTPCQRSGLRSLKCLHQRGADASSYLTMKHARTSFLAVRAAAALDDAQAASWVTHR